MHLSSSVNRERRDMVYGNHAPRGFSTNRFKAEFHPQLDHESGGGKKVILLACQSSPLAAVGGNSADKFRIVLVFSVLLLLHSRLQILRDLHKARKAKDFYSIYLFIYLFSFSNLQ